MRRTALKLSTFVFAALLVVAFATPVSAVVTTYYGLDTLNAPPIVPNNPSSSAAEAAFLNALATYGTQNFESFNPFGIAFDPQNLPFTGSSVTANTSENFVAASGYQAGYSTSGGMSMVNDAGQVLVHGDLVFSLSAPITAFGGYFMNVGDSGATQVKLKLENTTLLTSKEVTIGTFGPNSDDFSTFYFGLTDTDPFDKVTMIRSNSGDGIILDDIAIGQVPEPSTLVLLAGLSCGLVVLARRRRTA